MSPRLWPAVACCLLALAACSQDEADAGPVSTASTGTPAPQLDCSSRIGDEALTALGWQPGAAAEEDAGRCLRRVDGSGAVTVSTRAQTDGDADATLQAECEELRATGDYVAQPVDWLEPARDDSCAVGLGDTGTGVAELYFVNDAEQVVQVRVEALAPVSVEQLEAGTAAVAAAAGDLAD